MTVSASSSRHAVELGVLALAVADPEDRASLRHVVDRDERLRERRGMPAERLGHAGPDPHPAIARRRHPEHDERVEEGVGRRHELRRRRVLGLPERAGHEAEVVVRQEQAVDARELRHPHPEPLDPERRRARRFDSYLQARHACLRRIGHTGRRGSTDFRRGGRVRPNALATSRANAMVDAEPGDVPRPPVHHGALCTCALAARGLRRLYAATFRTPLPGRPLPGCPSPRNANAQEMPTLRCSGDSSAGHIGSTRR